MCACVCVWCVFAIVWPCVCAFVSVSARVDFVDRMQDVHACQEQQLTMIVSSASSTGDVHGPLDVVHRVCTGRALGHPQSP